MPLYPVKNLKTGEVKDLHMPIAKYEEWRKENPDWDKDWSQGCPGLRSRSKEFYTTDHIASNGSYEDKNDSLAAGEGVMDYDYGSDVNNDQVKSKYGWK